MKKNLVAIILIGLGIFVIFICTRSGAPLENISKNAGEKIPLQTESSRLPMVTSEAFASKREELRALLKADNAPIEFYGIVVDENGKQLEGVQVLWDVVKSGSFAPSLGLAARENGSISTSKDGHFTIKNQTGVTLIIKSLTKHGYHEVNRTVKSYGYGSNSNPHQPDRLKPETFVMRRDGGNRSIRKYIPLTFDWDGKIKEISIPLSGRNEVMFLTPEIIGQKSNSRDYNWRIKIQIKNALVVSGKMGDARIAPIDGYFPEIKLENDIEGQWGSEANALLYIKTADNQFGEVIFSAYSDRDATEPTGSLSIRWNPDGGRVFE
jgi:hypothetical protein